MNKSEMFKRAWNAAKIAANHFGGTAKEYFSECLKLVWKVAKRVLVTVPNWFIKKNLFVELGYDLRTVAILKETEKAVLVNIIGNELWCPKSIIEQ